MLTPQQQTLSGYQTCYAFRDKCLIDNFKGNIKSNGPGIPIRNKSLQKGIKPPVKFLFLIGDMETCKTWIQIHLTNLNGICFMCPTNIPGQVLENILNKQYLFGKSTLKVDRFTMYKHFCETPEDTDNYHHILNSSLNFAEYKISNLDSQKKCWSQCVSVCLTLWAEKALFQHNKWWQRFDHAAVI